MNQDEINNQFFEFIKKITDILERDARVDKSNLKILESLKDLTADLSKRVEKIENYLHEISK